MDRPVQEKELHAELPPKEDWLNPAELDALTPASLTQRTHALKPLLAAHAREAEQNRRPVPAVWNAIRKSGVFYHFVPKRYGGLEFDVDSFIDAMLPLGEGCASTAWVTSFCVEHNWMLSQFPEEAQAEIFGAHPYIIAPGVTQPPGKVVRTKGGYRLTGRWKWGTGVMNADWVLASGLDPDSGSTPSVLFFAMPVGDVRIMDTWYVDGMVGTGSNDIVADDVFIPAHRVLDFGHMREGRAPGALLHDNPIYKMPMLPFLAITAAIPAVSTAYGALNHFRTMLSERLILGTDQKQSEKPAAQMRLGEADILARTAELILRQVGKENVELGAVGHPANLNARIRLRAQVAYAMELSRKAVRIVCEASGSSAHALKHPIQRALRDINVMSSHVVYDMDVSRELHGRALLGLPPNSVLL